MIPYDGWDREYKQNAGAYIELFDQFMNQSNYENNNDFERRFAYRFGRKHCVSVASATDALHFSLLAHGIGPGDEVLVTDFSWISSASCVDMSGATPAFCDINLESYHMNIDSIRRMCSDRTKAIVYPHLFGNMSDTTEIQQFCRERGIVFIEDAAQSLGSSLSGVAAGTIGDCSVFSFNSNKVIAGINGGGVVLTDDDDVAQRVKQIRRHGKDKTFDTLGYNSRMYVLNAKIIELRMQSMEQNQQRRQQIAQQYHTAFADLPVHTQTMTEGLNHNYHKYVIRFEDKDTRKRVKDALGASIHYETPLSLNGMYRDQVICSDVCANAKKAADTVLSLPVHAWLTDDEINTISNSLAFLGR
jgi:dTDP-4-amino-4,6-dideoxygalactose transaminase